MPLSWNEIKNRAIQFSKEWEGETRERAEKDSFWNDFFNVFGISRRRVASFEKAVKKLNSKQGYIDLFWKGTLLVEHKSKGKDLDKALEQAMDYFHGLKEHELPKYVLVSDFHTFKLFDLDENTEHQFKLNEFINNIQLFGFIAGYEKRTYKEEDPVNIDAAYLMGQLHDKLESVGYTGHALEVYLVRLLFCLFADDTGIFEKGIFEEYIDLHTKEDGSDLAMHIAQIFQVLNTPNEQRLSNINESLDAFPYVNGQLFEEALPFASFDSQMRETLLQTSGLNWGKISPAIFGSMFQAAMNPKERRNLGAHYTSEKNIQKVIKPLFLDELYNEFEKAKSSRPKLVAFQKKLASLKFLDPACGSGNFLIITYRELRELEIQVLKEIFKKDKKQGQQTFGIEHLINVDVDQFYGIEIDEFAAKIAEVAMWLIDHQMNRRVSDEFGEYFVRLPLRKAATIVHGNALQIDWESVVPKEELNFILGNPPFLGYAYQSSEQKKDIKLVFKNVSKIGVLDYVTAWYAKAAKYMKGTSIMAAFVSTNSISQGEQVGILWNYLASFDLKINFAHRTFKWSNEAKANAGVHVIIIGFANLDFKEKYIYEYENISGEPQQIKVSIINPYLVEGKSVLVPKRSKPICNVPKMNRGSDPTDGGFLLLQKEDRQELIRIEPRSEEWIKPFLMAREFLYSKKRYCLWLKNISPKELKQMPKVLERVNSVKVFRSSSKRTKTKKMAAFPFLFSEDRQPQTDYLAIPKVSSENRIYIPIGYCNADTICGDKLFNIPNASKYLFGIISSKMHMTWVRYTCGRLESRYSYSNTIVYNNYPFPRNVSDKNKAKVEKAAQKVLDTRAKYPDSSLADLYDPLTMPPDLVKAHQQLDKAVDLCYRPQPFVNERNRIEFLFELYEEYTNPLLKAKK